MLNFILSVVLAQTGSDPIAGLTQLGIGGIAAGVVYLWQKDTAKQRDKAMEVVDTLTKGLNELRQAVDKSNEAHLSSSSAMKEMTAALKAMPSSETWYRLNSKLDHLDRLQNPIEGGTWEPRRSENDR